MTRLGPIALVTSSAAIIVAFLMVRPHVLALSWHERWLFANHTVFILVSFAAMALRGARPSTFGLSLHAWRAQLLFSLFVLLPCVLPALAVATIAGALRVDQELVRYPLATPLYQVVFVAFGEELLFRGFWQGQLNQKLGRPFRIGRTQFGWGALGIAAAFAVGHLLNPVWRGGLGVDWVNGIVAGGFALAAGLMRDRFESILAPVACHAVANVYPNWLDGTAASDSLYLWWPAIALLVTIVVLHREAGRPPNQPLERTAAAV